MFSTANSIIFVCLFVGLLPFVAMFLGYQSYFSALFHGCLFSFGCWALWILCFCFLGVWPGPLNIVRFCLGHSCLGIILILLRLASQVC